MAKREKKFPSETDVAGLGEINGKTPIMVAVAAGIKQLPLERFKDYVEITSIELEPIASGALPTPTAGQTRTMEVVGVGPWTHPTLPGGTVSMTEVQKGKLFFNGTSWSLKNVQNLPKAPTVSNLKQTVPGEALDATQGKVLNDKIFDIHQSVAKEVVLANKNSTLNGNAVNSSNVMVTVTENAASLNIDISSYTKNQSVVLKYHGNVQVGTATPTGVPLLIINQDDTIAVFDSFIEGPLKIETRSYVVPKGTKKISVTFSRTGVYSDFYVSLFTSIQVSEGNNSFVSLAKCIGNSKINFDNNVISISNNSSYCSTRFIKVKEATKVLLSGISTGAGSVLVGSTTNKNTENLIPLIGAGAYNKYEVTIPKGVNYILGSGLVNVTNPNYSLDILIPNNVVGDKNEPKPIAHWEFTEDQAPYYSKDGRFPLSLGNSNIPNRVSLNPKGGGLNFIGNEYLVLPNTMTEELNVGKYSNEVTLVAWIKKLASNGDSNSYVAGMWREDDNNPSRMYGMFTHLPVYGSSNKVVGHISRFGSHSPDIIYSRDMSSNGDSIIYDRYEMCAITYDGNQITSYKNGIADLCLDYKETTDTGVGDGRIYNKNPYAFDLGLNHNSDSDFTVGAVKLTGGFSNWFKGQIGEIMVFSEALSGDNLMRLHLQKLQGREILRFNFGHTLANFNTTDIRIYGWDCLLGPLASNVINPSSFANEKVTFIKTDTSVDSYAFVRLNSINNHAFIFKMMLNTIELSFLSKIKFTLNNTGILKCKIALKIKGKGWIISNSNFNHTGNGASAVTPVTKEQFELNVLTEEWKYFDVVPNSHMVVKNDNYVLNNLDAIVSFGVYFYDSQVINNIARVTDIIFEK